MFDRFTDRARKVAALARQEAQIRNHQYIGTEHILLGLVGEGSGVAANVLRNLIEIDPGSLMCRLREEVDKICADGPTMVTMGQLPWTPRAKKSLELACEEAGNMKHNYIGTEHLLLGLVAENDGVAAQVLQNLGCTLEEVREEICELLGCDMSVKSEEPRLSWDDYFVEMAKLVATRSKDRNTKIGAVIVGPDNEVMSTGYNSFPRDINDNVEERYQRPEKYFWFEHGERNAIYNAARRGAALKGCKMYLNCHIPCTRCARAIIQVGISEIVLGKEKNLSDNTKWKSESARSLQMFTEAGVILRYPNQSSI